MNPYNIKPENLKHLKPKYHRYNGGYANVTICRECKNIGLYEDQHIANPCNSCGGAVEHRLGQFPDFKYLSAKWNGKRWILKGDEYFEEVDKEECKVQMQDNAYFFLFVSIWFVIGMVFGGLFF